MTPGEIIEHIVMRSIEPIKFFCVLFLLSYQLKITSICTLGLFGTFQNSL